MAASSAAAEERSFCPDRPGLVAPACTMAPGKAALEINGPEFVGARPDGGAADTLLFGNMLARFGVTDDAEARFGWVPLGVDRIGLDTPANRPRMLGTGDVTLSLRQNLMSPTGSGTAFAVQPILQLPSGQSPAGSRTWSAGVSAPFSQDLAGGWKLFLGPEVNAAADASGAGRHLAYGLAGGLYYTVDESWTLGADLRARRDLDPGGASTTVTVDANVTYTLPGGRQVLYGQVNVGATPATPRTAVLFGFATRLN